MDCRENVMPKLSMGEKIELVRLHARNWLLHNRSTFPEVCSYAGLHPDMVRKHARRFEKDGWVFGEEFDEDSTEGEDHEERSVPGLHRLG